VLQELRRFEDALASHDRALELLPNFAEAHSDRGNALKEMARFEEALTSYDRALSLRPDFAEAHYNRGNTLYPSSLCRKVSRAMRICLGSQKTLGGGEDKK
jgi:tetratricopeptide (TPR) repeat protein